jgi:hypothetical protein
MTLEECIVAAVQNNLDIAVQVFNPRMTEMSIMQAKERFMPQLSFGFNRQSQQSASFSFLDTDETLLTDYGDWSARLDQEIPTGGRLSVNLSSYKNDTNQSFQIINPRYGSTLSFRFDQPLLKNHLQQGIGEFDFLDLLDNLFLAVDFLDFVLGHSRPPLRSGPVPA